MGARSVAIPTNADGSVEWVTLPALQSARRMVDVTGVEITELAVRTAPVSTEGLDPETLRVAYQPTVDLASGAVQSVEALVRWEHPEHGLLLASEFVPDAERNAATITKIDCWVLDTALRQLAQWHAQRRTRGIATVWVNLSAATLADDEVVTKIAAALAANGLEGSALGVELTEHVLSQPRCQAAILALHELGVNVAVDDFRTGSSSLLHLRDLPLEILKIDRAFIGPLGHEPATTAIVRAVVSLAHSLGMRATAEGVETTDQLAMLRALDCDAITGYLVCPPLPAEALAARVAEGPLC